MKKAGRNDPCPCGSGKKFKKCCELKMVRSRLSANRITSVSSSVQKASGLTSLFQNSLAALSIPKPLVPPPEMAPTTSQETDLEEKGNLLITS